MHPLTIKVEVKVQQHSPYHPLIAYFVDPVTGIHHGHEVRHRNMVGVRGYYNGYVAALYHAGVKEITLQSNEYPYTKQTFRIEVNPDFILDKGVAE